MKQVRVLVVDKTAVLRNVRSRWNRVAVHPEIDLTLLAPETWIENYQPYQFEAESDITFDYVIGRTIGTGRELRSIYTHGVREAFQRSRPDVVVMMEESFALFGLQIVRARDRYAPDAPLIFYNNNVASYSMPGYRLARLYRAIARYVTPRAAHGLCVNQRAQQVLDEAGYDVNSSVLFYGIDETLFTPVATATDQLRLRDELDLPPEAFIFLYLGRIMKLKGLQDLIQAFRQLIDRLGRTDTETSRRLHLLFVGSGPFEEELRTIAEQSGVQEQIEFRPIVPLEQVPDLLRAADVHVLPSRKEINEQFGRVNVEAMLTNTTVVASDSGGVPQVIGDGGYLFTAGDVEELSRLLQQIVENPEEAEKVRRRGMERGLEHFSTASFVSRMQKLILEFGRSEQLGDAQPS